MTVIDSSALLAFLQREAGAEVVERALERGAVCGAANWSEVAQKFRQHGRDWSLAAGLLNSYALVVEPVTIDDAETAARRWSSGDGLSLGDRLCLALADRLDRPVLTADTAWGRTERITQIR